MKQQEEVLGFCKDEEQFAKFQLEFGLVILKARAKFFIIGVAVGAALSACIGALIVAVTR